ncbi:MAG: hypothetical protein QOF56_3258 [Acidobacteriaceae bacterium]|jgi:hypothetical protein|nr:hypothetical protein [Acidobacteriaceae bacterium]
MEVGFKFEDIYRDADVLEVRVSGWNGAFGGVADIYMGSGRLGEVATLLQGFPSSVTDNREFTLGAFGGEFAGGGINLRFRTCGGAAPVVVESRIEANSDSAAPRQSVVLVLPPEAAAIDSFVEELRGIDRNHATVARLRGTT